MLGPQRRREIVALIERHGVIRISEVVRDFEVSRKTALRDLDLLDAQGLVDKVHGGAIAIVGPVARTEAEPGSAVAGPTGVGSAGAGPDSGSTRVGSRTAGPTDAGQLAAVPAENLASRQVPSERSRGRLPEHLRVGLVLPSRSHHNRAILSGASAVLAAYGATLDVAATGWIQPGDLGPYVNAAVESGIDGLLLRPSPATSERSSERHDWLSELPIPGVLVEDELLPGEQLPIWSVTTDDQRGVAAAIDHLRALGHRRIGLVTISDAPRSQELQRLWRDSLLRSGLDRDVPLIDGADFDSWPLPGPAALTEILQTVRSAGVTALICHSDVPAQALIGHVPTMGLSVPGGLSVLAYEDRISTRATTPVTTVVLPGHEVGRVAAESMLSLLQDPGRPSRQIRIAPELVVRGTTGPAPDAD